jgi:TATA-binding protein-associated factor Taf7
VGDGESALKCCADESDRDEDEDDDEDEEDDEDDEDEEDGDVETRLCPFAFISALLLCDVLMSVSMRVNG